MQPGEPAQVRPACQCGQVVGALRQLLEEVARSQPPPLMDAAQAAEWLNISARWLTTEAKAGRVPHTRLGRKVRFAPHHLSAIVTAHEAVVAQQADRYADVRAPRRERRIARQARRERLGLTS